MKNTIKETRKSKGMTQAKLAKMANISRPYLSEIENGISNPNITIVLAIANILETSVEILFCSNCSTCRTK